MAIFYSIFYASIRKVTQEKLSLGLLLFDDQNIYFKFSGKKLAGLKAFLHPEDFRLIHRSIGTINKKVREFGSAPSSDSLESDRIRHSAFRSSMLIT